jgi:hypothetical protein
MNREQLSLHWTVPWFPCVEMPSPDSATSPEGVIFVNGRPRWREVWWPKRTLIGWDLVFSVPIRLTLLADGHEVLCV